MISFEHLTFIDSLNFLNCSLAKLVENLAEEGKQKFPLLLQEFPNPTDQDLLLKKGLYPYSYMDGWEKFGETKLPPKEAFTNDLTGEPISDDDYTHAQHVWQHFNIKNLGEYHDLYCKTDVILLASVSYCFK